MTITENMSGFDIIFQFVSVFFLDLSGTGLWVQGNVSVEGLIALPALLATLLVALAIYNFEDSKKGLLIDAATIMKHVIKVPIIISSFFAVSILVIFYSIGSQYSWVIPILTIIYIAGIVILVSSLNSAYGWARSVETKNRQSIRTEMRLRYLYNLNALEVVPVWADIWREREQSKELIYQHELIKPFLDSVTRASGDQYSSMCMIDNFISALHTVDFTNPATIDEIAKFYIKESRKGTRKDAFSRGHEYLVYTNSIERLFGAIVEKTLQKDDRSLDFFIHKSQEYIKAEGASEDAFVAKLMSVIFSVIKNRKDINWILDALPSEWKVTVDNLNSKNNNRESPRAMLNAYSKMVNSANLYVNLDSKEKMNIPLQKITEEILPKADPILWAKLFAFHWAPFGHSDRESSEEAQIRNYIENEPSFGFMSHVHTGFYDDENDKVIYEDVAKEESEVIEIAAITAVFPFFHSEDAMGRYITAIDSLKLKYVDDETKVNKLSYLKDIIDKLTNKIEYTRSDKR